MRIHLEVREPDPVELRGLDLLVVPVASDRRPLRGVGGACDWELGGELSRTLVDERITGARGDRLLVHTEGRLGPTFVLMLGVGRIELFGPGELVPFFRAMGRVLDQAGVRQLGLRLAEFEGPGCERNTVATALLAGLLAGYSGDDLELWLLDGVANATDLTLEVARAAERFEQLKIEARHSDHPQV